MAGRKRRPHYVLRCRRCRDVRHEGEKLFKLERENGTPTDPLWFAPLADLASLYASRDRHTIRLSLKRSEDRMSMGEDSRDAAEGFGDAIEGAAKKVGDAFDELQGAGDPPQEPQDDDDGDININIDR